MTSKIILEVQEVELFSEHPRTLLIAAAGTVPTTGWSNPQLSPYIYITPPQDGIWDFAFVADAPTGPALDVITRVETQYRWDDFPPDLAGVRVHASTNSRVALLTRSPIICLKGVLTDEGVLCQGFRSAAGVLYTLVGNLDGFTNGDEVFLCGTIAQLSFCLQAQTIIVFWIGKQVPLAAKQPVQAP
jgi:hypothetical protein